jgi:co-chaperonin GroES (HSP10)
MVKMKEVAAKGEYVVLKFNKVEENGEMYKKKKSGILVPNGDFASPVPKKQAMEAKVFSIGSDVKLDVSVGDTVVFNDYDIKYIGDLEEDCLYGLTKGSSIMATYKT